MARAFARDKGRYVARLDETERAMLAGLMEQTRLLLAPRHEPTGDAFDDLVASMGVSLAAEDQVPEEPDASLETAPGAGQPGAAPPRDPALDRLLPSAHRGDEQVAAEFRRLTEESLRQRKSHNLDVAIGRLSAAYGDRVALSQEEATAFLMALTDVRLLLGERIGIRTEQDVEALHVAVARMPDDDPLGYAMAWYDFLAWLQETLTHAVLGEEGPDADARAEGNDRM